MGPGSQALSHLGRWATSRAPGGRGGRRRWPGGPKAPRAPAPLLRDVLPPQLSLDQRPTVLAGPGMTRERDAIRGRRRPGGLPPPARANLVRGGRSWLTGPGGAAGLFAGSGSPQRRPPPAPGAWWGGWPRAGSPVRPGPLRAGWEASARVSGHLPVMQAGSARRGRAAGQDKHLPAPERDIAGPVRGRRGGRAGAGRRGGPPTPGRAVCREARRLCRASLAPPHPSTLGAQEGAFQRFLPSSQPDWTFPHQCVPGGADGDSRPLPFLCAREPRGPSCSVTHRARPPVGGAWSLQPESRLPA